jgi:hypothetical protein
LAAWETAVTRLLREKPIRDRWHTNEFWALLASVTAAATSSDDPGSFIERNIELLRSSGKALTVLLIANVTWNLAPKVLDGVVIGNADSTFIEVVNATAEFRSCIDDSVAKSWLEGEVEPRRRSGSPDPAAIAHWSLGQHDLAFKEAERNLRNLVDLCLLLEKDSAAHEIYRRGSTNRPGIRGLTLDRGAVDRGIADSARLELGSMPLIISDHSPGRCTARWYGVEPLPLGRLLSQDYLRASVESCLRHDDPISGRVRVAARWYAEAHYSEADDDAALALGVAMDALLNGRRALPGNAMADRFALLAENTNERRQRANLDSRGTWLRPLLPLCAGGA